MKMIINADDFGLSKAVDYGIIEAFKNGVVTSTTALVNGEAFEDVIECRAMYPNLSIGIHLNITLGKAMCKSSSLCDEEGIFFPKEEYLVEFIHSKEDLYTEWKAQLDHYIQMVGEKPSHIDSHHHVHLLPNALDVVKCLAKEYDLKIRGIGDIELNIEFYNEQVTLEFFETLPTVDFLELMVHPAFVDNALLSSTSYALGRLKEYDILTSSKLIEILNESNIQLINYNEV